MSTWKQRAGAPFAIEKQPARASRGMVVTNHPLASAAGAEMLAAGGNAVDAAISALFALTVVEPMMVGIAGGGFAHLRLPDGTQTVLEGQGRCPAAIRPDTFTPDPNAPAGVLDAVGRRNSVGRAAVAVPGNLMAWCELLDRYGSLSLADVVEPAIRHAAKGFSATPFLADCVADCAHDMALDPEISKVFLPGGRAISAGHRVTNEAYADTLRRVVREGSKALYQGEIGRALTDDMARHGAYLSQADLQAYRTNELSVLRCDVSGFRNHRPAAALQRPAAHRADAEDPRRL